MQLWWGLGGGSLADGALRTSGEREDLDRVTEGAIPKARMFTC